MDIEDDVVFFLEDEDKGANNMVDNPIYYLLVQEIEFYSRKLANKLKVVH